MTEFMFWKTSDIGSRRGVVATIALGRVKVTKICLLYILPTTRVGKAELVLYFTSTQEEVSKHGNYNISKNVYRNIASTHLGDKE